MNTDQPVNIAQPLLLRAAPAYPAQYLDLFTYSPTFALLFAPFSLLPLPMAILAWRAAGTVANAGR